MRRKCPRVGTGNTEYTETKYYQVSREGDVKLENLTEQKANQDDQFRVGKKISA